MSLCFQIITSAGSNGGLEDGPMIPPLDCR